MYGSTRRDQARRSDSRRAGDPFDDDDMMLGGRWTRTSYRYELPNGELLYQQNRYDPVGMPGVDLPEKRFLPSRPNPLKQPPHVFPRDHVFGLGSKRLISSNRRIIYNWPRIITLDPGAYVFVTEGEKNAEDLIARDLKSTTTVISHEWTQECAAALAGRHAIILEDNDENGRKIARDARDAIAKFAASVRIVTMTHLWKHLPPGARPLLETDDISDWLELGGDPLKLYDICLEVPADGEIAADDHAFKEENMIPARDFFYEHHLLRGEVSLTAAPGGTGKSAKAIGDAIAMTTGRAVLGLKPPRPLRVLLINLEDDRNEMDRRIAAAMKRHGLARDDVGGRLFVVAKGELKLEVATQVRPGVVEANEAAIAGLIRFVKAKEIDVISVDPLRKTHNVSENDPAMGKVIECYERVATEGDCAVHIWHHTRKGNGAEVTVESARGTSVLIDAPRSVDVMETMSREIAENLGVAEMQRRRYFRAFNGKLNFAPPMLDATWFEIVSVEIDNAFPFGDDVGVVTRWTPPDVVDDMTPAAIDKIRRAVGPDPHWRASSQATLWVGKPVAEALGLDPARQKKVVMRAIAKLIASGQLKKVLAHDPGRREDKEFVIAPVAAGAAAGTATGGASTATGTGTATGAADDPM
jgi:AAA domain